MGAAWASAASVGSAVGSLVPYWIGYKGEELLLEKRIPPRTLDAVIAGVNINEEDPQDNSVGYGGLPGHVSLAPGGDAHGLGCRHQSA